MRIYGDVEFGASKTCGAHLEGSCMKGIPVSGNTKLGPWDGIEG